jgi:hypothetical protein
MSTVSRDYTLTLFSNSVLLQQAGAIIPNLKQMTDGLLKYICLSPYDLALCGQYTIYNKCAVESYGIDYNIEGTRAYSLGLLQSEKYA